MSLQRLFKENCGCIDFQFTVMNSNGDSCLNTCCRTCVSPEGRWRRRQAGTHPQTSPVASCQTWETRGHDHPSCPMWRRTPCLEDLTGDPERTVKMRKKRTEKGDRRVWIQQPWQLLDQWCWWWRQMKVYHHVTEEDPQPGDSRKRMMTGTPSTLILQLCVSALGSGT